MLWRISALVAQQLHTCAQNSTASSSLDRAQQRVLCTTVWSTHYSPKCGHHPSEDAIEAAPKMRGSLNCTSERHSCVVLYTASVHTEYAMFRTKYCHTPCAGMTPMITWQLLQVLYTLHILYSSPGQLASLKPSSSNSPF